MTLSNSFMKTAVDDNKDGTSSHASFSAQRGPRHNDQGKRQHDSKRPPRLQLLKSLAKFHIAFISNQFKPPQEAMLQVSTFQVVNETICHRNRTSQSLMPGLVQWSQYCPSFHNWARNREKSFGNQASFNDL